MKKNQEKQVMHLQVTESLAVELLPDKKHEFLMPTKEVAKGFGISISTLRSQKSNHSDELIEGKHFLSNVQILDGSQNRRLTLWTKRGIIRLGFFIKSQQAKFFRDWTEDLVIDTLNKSDILQVVDEAVVIIGSHSKLSARIGISPSILSHLRNNPNMVSSEMASRIETVCKHIINHGVGIDMNTVRLLLDVDKKSTRLALFERLIGNKSLEA